jgi:hypothetical protein
MAPILILLKNHRRLKESSTWPKLAASNFRLRPYRGSYASFRSLFDIL